MTAVNQRPRASVMSKERIKRSVFVQKATKMGTMAKLNGALNGYFGRYEVIGNEAEFSRK